MDLAPLAPVLSHDEVGDLVRVYNALQQRVQMQQEEVEGRQWQLIALQSLSYKIGTARDVTQLLQEVVRDVERAFGYHNVAVLLVDEERNDLGFAAASHVDAALRDRRFKIGEEGVVGHVAATGKPLLVNDVGTCGFYIADRTNTRSEMAVPLITGDKVIGVFNMSSERIGAFDESDLRTVTALGVQVATATENARLYESQRARTEGLDLLARGAEAERQSLEAALGALDQALLVADQKGQILWASRAFRSLLNLAGGQDLEGMPILEMVPQVALQQLVVETAGGKVTHAQQIVLTDGRCYLATATCADTEDHCGRAVVVFREMTTGQ